MKENNIATIWNANADESNQWHDLGPDEKIEFAYELGSVVALSYLVNECVIPAESDHLKGVVSACKILPQSIRNKLDADGKLF